MDLEWLEEEGSNCPLLIIHGSAHGSSASGMSAMSARKRLRAK
jgi:hypothetical protein